MLGLLGHWVTIFDEEVADVPFHCKAAFAFLVIPDKIDSCKFGAFPIGSDIMVFAEDVGKMVSVFSSHVFNAKIIND